MPRTRAAGQGGKSVLGSILVVSRLTRSSSIITWRSPGGDLGLGRDSTAARHLRRQMQVFRQGRPRLVGMRGVVSRGLGVGGVESAHQILV